VILSPRYWVPLGVLGLGAACLALSPLWRGALWLALVVVLMGVFLGIQATILRLRFQEQALVVSRKDAVIRTFPYAEWIAWRIFWSPLPILFYFREHHSPHLVPMLFDAEALRLELERRLGAPPAPTEP
jgi:hypothetical protein